MQQVDRVVNRVLNVIGGFIEHEEGRAGTRGGIMLASSSLTYMSLSGFARDFFSLDMDKIDFGELYFMVAKASWLSILLSVSAFCGAVYWRRRNVINNNDNNEELGWGRLISQCITDVTLGVGCGVLSAYLDGSLQRRGLLDQLSVSDVSSLNRER